MTVTSGPAAADSGGETHAPAPAAGVDDRATGPSTHAQPEPVGLVAPTVVRLERALHGRTPQTRGQATKVRSPGDDRDDTDERATSANAAERRTGRGHGVRRHRAPATRTTQRRSPVTVDVTVSEHTAAADDQVATGSRYADGAGLVKPRAIAVYRRDVHHVHQPTRRSHPSRRGRTRHRRRRSSVSSGAGSVGPVPRRRHPAYSDRRRQAAGILAGRPEAGRPQDRHPPVRVQFRPESPLHRRKTDISPTVRGSPPTPSYTACGNLCGQALPSAHSGSTPSGGAGGTGRHGPADASDERVDHAHAGRARARGETEAVTR